MGGHSSVTPFWNTRTLRYSVRTLCDRGSEATREGGKGSWTGSRCDPPPAPKKSICRGGGGVGKGQAQGPVGHLGESTCRDRGPSSTMVPRMPAVQYVLPRFPACALAFDLPWYWLPTAKHLRTNPAKRSIKSRLGNSNGIRFKNVPQQMRHEVRGGAESDPGFYRRHLHSILSTRPRGHPLTLAQNACPGAKVIPRPLPAKPTAGEGVLVLAGTRTWPRLSVALKASGMGRGGAGVSHTWSPPPSPAEHQLSHSKWGGGGAECKVSSTPGAPHNTEGATESSS